MEMMSSPIKRFWNLLKIYKSEIRQLYIYSVLISFINLSLPLGIQAIVNFLQTGTYTSTWLLLVFFVLFGILVGGIFQLLQFRVVENIQQDIFVRSSFEFAYRFPKIAYINLDKFHAPELVNRFFDTLTIQKGVPKILIDFSLAIFQITFGIILLTIYSPFFIIIGIILSIIFWLIFKVTGPKGLSTSINESKYKYKQAHWLEEIARVSRIFKLYNKNDYHIHKTDHITGNYLEHRESHFKVLLTQFRMFIGLKIVVAAGLLLLGGLLVFNDQLNIGQFVAAEIIIILIINSIEKLLTTIEVIYDVLTALDKIGNITDLPLDQDNGTAMVKNNEGLSISIEEIVFGFPDHRKKIFDEFSIQIKANEKVVLEGNSGSGKSILLQILAGIYQIEEGEIYINQIPISNFKKEQYHDNMGISLPVNQLFEDSIKENILIGRSYDEEKMNEILQLLGLQHYINRQIKGIETQIDTGGRSLPRGVIQKILLARLLIGEPKLLLLEDPLLFLEAAEKRKIIDYIMDPEKKWTVMVISDYPYWKEKSTRIINT